MDGSLSLIHICGRVLSYDSGTPGAVFKTVFVSIRRKNQLFLKEEKKDVYKRQLVRLMTEKLLEIVKTHCRI